MSPADNQSCLVGAEDTVSLLVRALSLPVSRSARRVHTGSSSVVFPPQVCAYHTLEDWAGLSHLEDYLSYLEYLLWVFTPLAIVFILPFLIVIFLYLSILFLYVYKVHKRIMLLFVLLNLLFGEKMEFLFIRTCKGF